MVGRDGFEPSNPEGGGFTVRCTYHYATFPYGDGRENWTHHYNLERVMSLPLDDATIFGRSRRIWTHINSFGGWRVAITLYSYMAGITGLEPIKQESKSCVLPITPYPNIFGEIYEIWTHTFCLENKNATITLISHSTSIQMP